MFRLNVQRVFFNRGCRLSRVKDNINPISEEWCRLSRVKDNIIFHYLFPFRTHAIKVYVAYCYDTKVNFQLSISVHCLRECITLENRRNHVNFWSPIFLTFDSESCEPICTASTPVEHFAEDDFCIRTESKRWIHFCWVFHFRHVHRTFCIDIFAYSARFL